MRGSVDKVKLLTDRTVPDWFIQALRDNGHDVLAASESGYQPMDDAVLWQLAQQEGRRVISSDEDLWKRHSKEQHYGIVSIPADRFATTDNLERLLALALFVDDDMKLEILQRYFPHGARTRMSADVLHTDIAVTQPDEEEHGNLHPPHRRSI